ncbi:extracellular solute-binding protein [Stagnihabitans tardus]|uniref:Extracellular solute-binding protein n=1 Tax=Stagnihabitans tardus TaxID=2699202 RepID=A0AAE4YDS9_9RHOB|nr:extracellular solute-binding protein [Stagnihabitans tardus]
MVREVTLKGMTWSDPRGYDPVVAAAAEFFRMHPGVRITWDKRSLQGFESTPIDELAATYDLMVIDHPHVGAVVLDGCLLPIDLHADAESLLRLEGETVGKSFASYRLDGHQWALPIDAATQVQAIRPDLQPAPVQRWDQVMEAARDGAVLWPLRPPHVLMGFYTLSANLGDPCAVTKGPLISRKTGFAVLQALQAMAELVDPACRTMDPIAALNALAYSPRHRIIPLTYLYAPYALEGYRPNRIAFHDIPAIGIGGPIGSALGGTGIAISARTTEPALCTRFAIWLASAEVQRGLYSANNGQPGNARAWGDPAVNAAVGNAYANTRLTHEAAWLRPRHKGYMAFQEEGSQIVLDAITGRTSHATALDALDQRFIESFPE